MISNQKFDLTQYNLKIFGIEDGIRFEIRDLYWFEEQGIHDWNGQGHFGRFKFEIELSANES